MTLLPGGFLTDLEELDGYDLERRLSIDEHGEFTGAFKGIEYGNAHYIAKAESLQSFQKSWSPTVGWANSPQFKAYRLCQYNHDSMTAYVRAVKDEKLLFELGKAFGKGVGFSSAQWMGSLREEKQAEEDAQRGIPQIGDYRATDEEN